MIAFCCISLLTVALLVCWFRYSCLLLLGTRTSQDYSNHVVQASRLTLAEIQTRLDSAGHPRELLDCREALERDYRVVRTLIHQTPSRQITLSSEERTLLRVDYEILRLWNDFSCHCFGRPSRSALREISSIVRCFANAAGSAGVLSHQA